MKVNNSAMVSDINRNNTVADNEQEPTGFDMVFQNHLFADAEKDTDFSTSFANYVEKNKTELDISEGSMRSLFTSAPLLLPTENNASKLTDYLKIELKEFFSKNDIPVDPPIDITLSEWNGEVLVEGNRDDIDEIKALLNSNKNARETINGVLSTTSGWANIQEDLQFQKEFMQSNGSDAVLRKYAHLFTAKREFDTVHLLFGNDSKVMVGSSTIDVYKAKYEV